MHYKPMVLSDLNLVVTTIVLWNTLYLERAVQAMGDSGKNVDDALLPYLSPAGLEAHSPDR